MKKVDRKIVLVKRKSRLDELVVRFNSISQARFYIEHLGADFNDYQNEHDQYAGAITSAVGILGNIARVQELDRAFLPNFIFGADDIVIAMGQDGLVANTMKYLDGQPLVGVNPAPDRWDGVLLPFTVDNLELIIPEVMKDTRKYKEVTLAKVQLNNGQSLLAVNDFFIGQKTHVSARYQITYGTKVETQSSSGIIISTGLGSTGWLKSVMTGSIGIVNALSRKNMTVNMNSSFGWNSDFLYFSVREPFPTRTTGADLVFGKITNQTPIRILSQMAENGVIFSDGIESDFLDFNSGAVADIKIAEKKGKLIV